MAATFDTYYINGSTFSDATSIFTDAAMTTVAPDGTYQFNGVHRTLSGGDLGSPYFCGTCCANCSGTYIYPIPPAKNRYHEVCSNIGTVINVAIVVKFKFTSIPVQLLGYPLGLRAGFNGQFYQGVSSNRFGYLPELYVGNNNWFSPADMQTYSPYNLDGYAWQPLTSSFVPTQAIPTWITTAMVNVTLNNPDECYMLIPKISPSTTATVQVFSPHEPTVNGGGGCNITIPCPTPLIQFRTSPVAAGNITDACGDPITASAYVMRVTSASGLPKMFDRVFSDAAGTTPLAAGYYALVNVYQGAVATTAWMHVVGTSGTVQATGTCSGGGYPALTEVVASTPMNTAIQACDYQNQSGINLPDITYWHNGAADAPAVGDTMYTDVLGTTTVPDGFYQTLRQYANFSTIAGVVQNPIQYCS
jgi:hypothetical protein